MAEPAAPRACTPGDGKQHGTQANRLDTIQGGSPRMQQAACILFASFALAVASPALAQQPAPQVRPGAQSTITLRGFVNATGFLQDNTFGFGNGQNAAWANPNPPTNPWILSGDVRNTRLGLDFRGPPIGGGWGVNGTIEMDFFGDFGSFPAVADAFTDEQPLPRLRIAYADLTRAGTTIRIGQFWSPLFGYVPASVSHLSFPLGYGSAGKVGWRFPGIFFYQNLTDAEATTRAQLQLAAMRGSWAAGTAAVVDHLSPGETSGFPQLQARLDLGGRTGGIQWGAYAVAHYDQKDLRPYGTDTPPAGQDERLDGQAFSAGLRIVPGPLTLHGSAYTGRAIGHNFGQITQFGDIGSTGGWAQAGFAFNPNWSVWGYYGTDRPDQDEVRTASPTTNARLHNQLTAAMLRYTSGPYQLGFEWIRAETEWWLPAGNPREQTGTGNQYSFSVVYSF